ncbi:MAG: transporter substrate-binding domain-containing protein [Proteobacteria bacterium]|nr:transporter substrate-binding domain-containing protein [Pseudomonadota bacterium]MBU1585873.1 transporter substrate-binding domain-containing protein [Pseudomonadota bacterium]MBU2631817.1 transporter substrate-binding domain-containing protein [Pseudomonadota bacterium]
MKKYVKQILLCSLLLIALACPVQAAEKLIIVRGQDFPPYHYLDEKGVEKGFEIEIIIEVARLLGTTVSFKQYPWSRCINMVEKGYADAMMNLFKTKNRETFLHFDDSILCYETNTFFTLKTTNLSYSGDIKTMTAYKIGTIRNYSYGKRFDAVHFPLNYQMETEQELIKSLINKRCEVIIGNNLTLQILLNQTGLQDKIKALKPDVSKDPLYIGFSKVRGHKAFSKAFSEKLNQFKTSEKYQKILRAYALENP